MVHELERSNEVKELSFMFGSFVHSFRSLNVHILRYVSFFFSVFFSLGVLWFGKRNGTKTPKIK